MKSIFLTILLTFALLTTGCGDSGIFPRHPGLAYLDEVEEYDPVVNGSTLKAYMPAAKLHAAAAALNGYIYVMGGGNAVVFRYDVASDTWSQVAGLPTMRSNLRACALGSKIYAIGGAGGSRILEEYDTTSDTWTRRADSTMDRIGHAAAVAEGKIYVFGGQLSSAKSVECYDPATDTWSFSADMLIGGSNLVAESLNGKVYIFGGKRIGSIDTTVEEYDLIADTWAEKSDMPSADALACCVANGKVHVVSSRPDYGWCLNTFDPTADAWQQNPQADFCCPGRIGFCYVTISGKLYIISGAVLIW